MLLSFFYLKPYTSTFHISYLFVFTRKLLLYPNGVVEGKGVCVSLFLALDASTLPANTKLVVDCTLRAKDQISGQNAQRKCKLVYVFLTILAFLIKS